MVLLGCALLLLPSFGVICYLCYIQNDGFLAEAGIWDDDPDMEEVNWTEFE